MTDIVMDGSKQIAKSLRDQASTHRAYAARLEQAADLISPPVTSVLKPVRKQPTRKPRSGGNKPAQATVYAVQRAITDHPGLTIRELAEYVEKSTKTVQNCIKILQREEKIRATRHNGRSWQYAPLANGS